MDENTAIKFMGSLHRLAAMTFVTFAQPMACDSRLSLLQGMMLVALEREPAGSSSGDFRGRLALESWHVDRLVFELAGFGLFEDPEPTATTWVSLSAEGKELATKAREEIFNLVRGLVVVSQVANAFVHQADQITLQLTEKYQRQRRG